MSAFLAVFAREFRLRRVLLIGAFAIGLMALVVPRLQGQVGATAAETAVEAALLLSLLTCGIFALVLGSGAVVRDLVEGRLGFDFVRPISGFSIWAGRIGSAVTLLFASAVLVVAPAFLVGWLKHSFLPKEVGYLPTAAALGPNWTFVASLLCCLALLFLSHVGVLLFASRSAALGLDLVGLLAVGLLVGAALTRLHRSWAQDAFSVGATSYLALFLIVLTGATLVQLLVGRTDLARGHRVLSIALWVPLLLGALALEAASRWVVTPKVTDLAGVDVVFEAPAGSWFSVGGKLRNRGALSGRFLIDAATGRVVRQGVSRDSWFFPTTFSSDGRVAAWFSDSPTEMRVLWTDISAAKPKVENGPISFERAAEIPALSPTGRWLATRSDGRLLIFELRTGRLVASVPVNSDWSAVRTAWTGEDRLRCWNMVANAPVSVSSQISIAEIQVPSEPGAAALQVGFIELPAHGISWDVSRDGATLLVRETGTGHREIFDGRTGDAVGVIDEPRQSSGDLLRNGLVAIRVRLPESRSLAIYDRTGTLRRRFDLGGYPGLLLAGQPTPTTILASVAAGGAPSTLEARRLILFDLAAGTIREVGRGRVPPLDPAESKAKVVLTGPATFARWDPATETFQPIVPR